MVGHCFNVCLFISVWIFIIITGDTSSFDVSQRERWSDVHINGPSNWTAQLDQKKTWRSLVLNVRTDQSDVQHVDVGHMSGSGVTHIQSGRKYTEISRYFVSLNRIDILQRCVRLFFFILPGFLSSTNTAQQRQTSTGNRYKDRDLKINKQTNVTTRSSGAKNGIQYLSQIGNK